MRERIVLSAAEHRKRMAEIEKITIEECIEEIMEAYIESENLQPKTGGWPGYTSFYNPGGDYIMLPKITTSHVPYDTLSPEERAEENHEDLYKGNDVEDEVYREEKLRNKILEERTDQVLDGFKACKRARYELKRQDSKAVLSGPSDLLECLENEFFNKLNSELKKLNLPQLNMTYIDYHQEETTEEDNGRTYHYPEALSFNVESWSTHKLCLFGNKGVNNGTFDLDNTVEIEHYILNIIDEVKEWVAGMSPEYLEKLLLDEPKFVTRSIPAAA